MAEIFLISTHDAGSRGSSDGYSTVAACATLGMAKEKACSLCSNLAGTFDQKGPDSWEYDIGADYPVRVQRIELEGGPDMGIAELCAVSAKIASEHGWHTDFVTQSFLAIGEIAEAGEEFRNHRGPNEIWYSKTTKSDDGKTTTTTEVPKGTPGAKPEGIPIEYADAIIRMCDWSGQNGVDLATAIQIKLEYNRTRPFRHGGKKI